MERQYKIDDAAWSDRSEFWSNYAPKKLGRKKKYKFREPLILVGHGVQIRVDHKTLLIRTGFTHYPQKSETIRFFPGDPNLPDRIIIFDATGRISFDALNWMSEQKIAFVQLDWRGRVNFSGNAGYSADPKLVRWQLEIQASPKATEINRRLIVAKLDASIETLNRMFGLDTSKTAIKKIQAIKSKIQSAASSNSRSTILGYEGAAAAIYYSTWHGLPLNWAKMSSHPIPSYWTHIGSRQMAWRKDGNFARHPLNAMLNYGYAILISEIQATITAAGYDSSIGIAHQRHTNPIPLIYDLMEPLRPVVDREILKFALSHTFAPGDFTINKSGGCRLNPQLAKEITKQVCGLSVASHVQSFLTELR